MSCLTKAKVEDVPWFSASEWMEVYKNVFGKKYEDWVKAYNHISVWKARIYKLPAGIECTIPLLHAQIALENQSLDESVKSTILQMAILRFVSVATKSHVGRFLIEKKKKKMHDLAEEMNLPLYLIDIRNQIIHSDNISGSTETCRIALTVCIQWIRTNYWEREEKEHKRKTQQPENLIEFKKVPKIVKTINTENKISARRLRLLLANRVSQFTTCCGKPKDRVKEKKLERAVNLHIISYCASEPEDGMNILVSNLFLSKKLLTWLKKSGGKRTCHCKLHSMYSAFTYFAPHLFIILEIKGINIFISSLIGDGTDPLALRRKWVKMLINLSIEGTRERKTFLKENGVDLWKFVNSFHWKKHIYTLFSIANPWTVHLAMYIHRNNLVKIGPETIQSINKLINFYNIGLEEVRDQQNGKLMSKENILKSCNNIQTIEDLIIKSRRDSESAYQYVTELCSQLNEDHKVKIPKKKKMFLGVLPHQVGDPYFYKKLILPEIK